MKMLTATMKTAYWPIILFVGVMSACDRPSQAAVGHAAASLVDTRVIPVIPPDRWVGINRYNESFWAAIKTMACNAENSCTKLLTTSSWPRFSLSRSEMESFIKDDDYSIDLYHLDCKVRVPELRTRRWRQPCLRDNVSACEPERAEKGEDALKRLRSAGWFSRARSVIIACFESCAASEKCDDKGNPPQRILQGQLADLRCQQLLAHLTNEKDPFILAERLLTARVACDMGPDPSMARRAEEQRISLIFDFPSAMELQAP